MSEQILLPSERPLPLRTGPRPNGQTRLGRKFAQRNFVFGTDNEPFMLYIDKETLRCRAKSAPWALRLFNHQGAVRLSAEEILFAGGVNFLFNRVYERSFIFNLRTKEVAKLARMLSGRFFAAHCLHQGRVWAVGGRGYGEDGVAIMSECETFNPQSRTWSLAPSLLTGRCQAACFVLNDRIYVAGGLTRDGRPTSSIETFSAPRNRWEAVGLNLNERIMGFLARPVDRSTVAFIGGMSTAPNKWIELLELGRGDLGTSRTSASTFKHCTAKLVVLNNGFLVFGGISDEVEIFGPRFEGRQSNNDERGLCVALVGEYGRVSKESYGLTKCSHVTAD